MIETLLNKKIELKQTTVPDEILPFIEKRLERNRIMKFIFKDIPSQYTYLDEQFECYHITNTEEYIYNVTFSVSDGSIGIYKIKCIVYKNNGNLYLQTVETKNQKIESTVQKQDSASSIDDIDHILKDLEISGQI